MRPEQRIWLERAFRAGSFASAIAVAGAVAVFIGFLLSQSAPGLNFALFFGDTPPLDALFGRSPVWDGIYPALVGSLCVIALASLLALPLGIASGIFAAEYLKGWPKALFCFASDVLAGLPSIIIGLFGFALILLLRSSLLPQANTSLLLSAVCLACLILPYLISMTRNSLEALPSSLRLIGPSLGLSRAQTLRHVLLPACRASLLSGAMLAISRAAEDTAVLMMTGVVASAGLPSSLTGHFEALPFFIYFHAAEARTPEDTARAFGATLVLMLICSALSALALFVAHRLADPRQEHA